MPAPTKPPKKGQVTESRVKHIVGLMVSSQWVPHHTKEALAVEWGILPGTVEHYACEASRRIRSTIAEGPELRATILANLQTIAALCVKGKRYTDAIKAYQVMAGVEDVTTGGGSAPQGETQRHDVHIHYPADAAPGGPLPQPPPSPPPPGSPPRP